MSEQEYYRVAKWSEFQHYRDRNPPWIKLHFALLSSETWVVLDDASRVLAVACMLIASKNDGCVPNKPEYLQRVAYLHKRPDFSKLLSCGFLERASTMLADARPETETETETEKNTMSGRKPDRSCPDSNGKIPYAEIVALLNAVTGRSYKPATPTTQKHIRARWAEGFRLPEFEAVIRDRFTRWGSDPNQAQYLRPETLFGTKFESYLQAARNKPKGDTASRLYEQKADKPEVTAKLIAEIEAEFSGDSHV